MRQWIAYQIRGLSCWLDNLADRLEPEPEPAPWNPRYPILTTFEPNLTFTDELPTTTWASKYIDPSKFDPTVHCAEPE